MDLPTSSTQTPIALPNGLTSRASIEAAITAAIPDGKHGAMVMLYDGRKATFGIATKFGDGWKLGAGVDWDDLAATAAANGWAGIECLSGIPGRVGATPIQNVGAYGQDVSETITAVEAFDLAARRLVVLSNEECGFGYRSSRFKGPDRGRYIILAVEYRLVPGGAAAVRYPDVQRHLAERGVAHPSLGQVRQSVVEIRRRKSMVLDAADPNARSVGSFFMNPVVSDATCAARCSIASPTSRHRMSRTTALRHSSPASRTT